MEAYRADRVVRVLTVLVSAAYFLGWVTVATILIGLPIARAYGDEDFTIDVPVMVPMLDARADAEWDTRAGRVRLADARAELEVPIRTAPVSFVAITWLSVAGLSAFLLLFLHHLRRLFQRVRDGAPFDLENARRLRWMGLLLLALSVLDGVLTFAQTLVVRNALAESGLELGAPLEIEGNTVFLALVLIALAEIFRRGSALEEDQSLVV